MYEFIISSLNKRTLHDHRPSHRVVRSTGLDLTFELEGGILTDHRLKLGDEQISVKTLESIGQQTGTPVIHFTGAVDALTFPSFDSCIRYSVKRAEV